MITKRKLGQWALAATVAAALVACGKKEQAVAPAAAPAAAEVTIAYITNGNTNEG